MNNVPQLHADFRQVSCWQKEQRGRGWCGGVAATRTGGGNKLYFTERLFFTFVFAVSVCFVRKSPPAFEEGVVHLWKSTFLCVLRNNVFTRKQPRRYLQPHNQQQPPANSTNNTSASYKTCTQQCPTSTPASPGFTNASARSARARTEWSRLPKTSRPASLWPSKRFPWTMMAVCPALQFVKWRC